jgi:hypothetical protein
MVDPLVKSTLWIAGLLLTTCGSVSAADLSKIDRRIRKEPAYATPSPVYALLVLGPEGRDRIWIVKDGNILYVDRTGNGDLTEPGKKLLARKGSSAEDGYQFETDGLIVNGKKHYRCSVGFTPLTRAMFREYAQRPDARAALKKDSI